MKSNSGLSTIDLTTARCCGDLTTAVCSGVRRFPTKIWNESGKLFILPIVIDNCRFVNTLGGYAPLTGGRWHALPLVSAQNYLQGLIDGLVIPGPANLGVLQAFITPPDPNFDAAPAAYIWPTHGSETRQSIPRNIGIGTRSGWKTIEHSLDIWLAWFGEDTDPNADTAFTSIVDAVMFTLRTSPDPAQVTDPDSSIISQLVGVGERMTWDLSGVRSVEDERYLRYSAMIRVPFLEYFQS